MSLAVQRRRGTTIEHAAFTGADGELTIDTTKKTVVVHDGVTVGGVPLAKESDIPEVPTLNERVMDPFKQGTHNGLNFAYGVGIARADNVVARTEAGTLVLTDDTINYIEVTTTGIINANSVGYTVGRIPLYKATTIGGVVSSVQDDRSFFSVATGGSGGGYTLGWNITLLSLLTDSGIIP